MESNIKTIEWEIIKKLKMNKIRTALISVSDKENLKDVLKVLRTNKINIISSGGTFRKIKKLGFSCLDISTYTGFDEMLDGRVKPYIKFTLVFYLKEIKFTSKSNEKKNLIL